jgi:nucleoside-diphosphate-sugar epimerase
VLITGAGGFLGRATVAAALAAGHEVLALHRPASSHVMNPSAPGLTWVTGDLRQQGEWRAGFAHIEAVIHCAAAASGDLSTQMAGTVLATENLLAALPSDLSRFVHVSSFSVYDFDEPSFMGMLSEDTSMEQRPLRRDAYTQTKLIQEKLVRRWAAERGIALVVARPGAIYGPGKTWDYGRALALGGLDLVFAPLAQMRLIHVDNCAETLVAALTAPVERELIVNLVDAEQPTRWRFRRLARRAGAPTGVGVPVPYAFVVALGLAARLASRLFFRSRARLPELLDPPRQRAQWRPLRYSCAHAQAVLRVAQRVSLEAGVSTMVAAESERQVDVTEGGRTMEHQTRSSIAKSRASR